MEKNKKTSFKFWYLYPILVGMFPILSFYLNNFYQVGFLWTMRSMCTALLVALILYGVALLIFKQSPAARVMSSLVSLIVMTYGLIYDYLFTHEVFGINLARARYLLTILIVLLAVVLYFTSKKKTSVVIDKFIGWFALALIAIFAINLVVLNIKSQTAAVQSEPASQLAFVDEITEKPNIYHIIMDGYTSSDVLLSDFGFDNSEFENKLKTLGFYIPDKTCSNYDKTQSSLGSELNMNWVNDIVESEPPDLDQLRLINKMVNSQVRSTLEGYEYTTIAFENEFRWSLWNNADIYLSPKDVNYFKGSLNEFESMFLKNTIFKLVMNYDDEIMEKLFGDFGQVNFNKYTEQTYILDTLQKIDQYESPKYVFAHTTLTHVPYVFDENGFSLGSQYQGCNQCDVNDPKIREGYIISIQYADKKILSIVKTLIKKDPNSIIILQGDHGYPGDHRNKIFFAVYDPRNSINEMDVMTPINLFRLIFNNWYGSDYPLLENQLYQTLDEDTYQFTDIGFCESY